MPDTLPDFGVETESRALPDFGEPSLPDFGDTSPVQAPPLFFPSTATIKAPAAPMLPATGERSTTFGGPPKAAGDMGQTVRDIGEGIGESLTHPGVPFSELVPEDTPDDSPLVAVGKHAAKLALGLPEFLTSAAGVETASAGALAPTLTAGAFTVDMLHSLGKQIQETIPNWSKMTTAQKAGALTDMGGTAVMAMLTGKHATTGVLNKVVPARRVADMLNKSEFSPEPRPGLPLVQPGQPSLAPPMVTDKDLLPPGKRDLSPQGEIDALMKGGTDQAPKPPPVVEPPAVEPAATPDPAAMTPEEHEARYLVVKSDALVDGREQLNPDHVPNMSSIGSSIDNPKILPGIREVPMSDFTLTGRHYSVEGQKKIDALAEGIKASGQISPLIVVRDHEGAYILEGATRADALFKLGAKSFPAKVVLDIGDIDKSKPAAPPAPAAEPTPAKEPWQMTKAEIVSRDKAIWGDQSTEQGQQAMLTAHWKHVKDAIRDDLPVPPEVMAEYPDLKPTPATVAAPPASSVGLSAPVDLTQPVKPKRSYNMAALRAPADEFKQLVLEHGIEHSWIKAADMDKIVPELRGIKSGHSSASMAATVAMNKVLKPAYLKALADIGIKAENNTLKLHAEALPKLKALLEKHDAMVPVPLAQVPDGSTFTRLGEEHTVKGTNSKTGMVTIEDGIRLKVHMDDSVKIDPGSLKTPETPKSPQLGAMEKGTGDLLKKVDEPFSLAGEVQGDPARIAAERASAEKSKADAAALAKKQQPDMFGMGGAVPSEFGGNETFVSNMFASIDRDRAAMGKPPMGPTVRKTWSEAEQRALSQMNREPNWIPDLLDRMEKKPRPLSQEENAAVVFQRAAIKAEYNNALQRIARAFDDNRTEDITTAKVDAAVFEDKLERLDRIVGRNGTGSEAGRRLQALKMGTGDDFTLVEMTLQKRASVGGRRLTPDETAAIKKDVDRLTELNAALQKSLADVDARASSAEAARAVAEMKSKVAPFDKRVLAAAENIVLKMEKAAQSSADALRAKLSQMSAGVDPTIIYHAAVVGSAKIARAGLDLAKFTDEMVKEFGPKIAPMISDIWKKSNEMLESQLAKVPGSVKDAFKKRSPEQVRKSVVEAVTEHMAKKEPSKITFEVQKLARMLIANGITEREPLIDAVHEILKDTIPGQTRRATMDMISGYGDFRRLSKDRISVLKREMSGEMIELAKLEDMEQGRPPLKSGVERGETTEARRQLIKRVNDAKNKFQVPIQDPNTQLKSALDTLKTTLKNRIADYEDRLARKDYAPRPRREVQFDTQATRLKAEAERIKKRWRDALLADRMKNRLPWEKALDWSTKFRRFTALSSPVVIPKLLGAAGWRAVATVADDVAGRVVSLFPGVREISKRAPLEGAGGQLAATMRGFGAAFTQGLKDAADVAKTGHSDIDVLYGKHGESYTGESELASVLLGLPGRSHGVIKAPVKRGAFEKSVQRLGEYYARQGLEVTSEPVKRKIAIEAYKAGNRAIFLQDNRVASGFNAALAALERKGESGHPAPGGKVLATMARFMFPVTRVPTNIAAETLQYSTGLVTGSVRAVNAIRKGLDTLTPDQFDLIMRELKKGLVGTAALFLGYIGYQSVGGVYEQGKKRERGDVKPGAIRMFDTDIAGNLLHHPIINTIQLGATIHRTAEDKLRRKDVDAQGLSAGVMAASWGLAEEVPFISGPSRLFQGLKSPYTRENTFGNEVGSIAIPQAVAWLAQVLDERRETPPENLYQRITGPPARLNPRGVWQPIETRIPGLRQQVPAKPVK